MKDIKKYLNIETLNSSFYDGDTDTYDLDFLVDNPEDGKTYLVSICGVELEDEAAKDEHYLLDDEVLKKIISETPEESIAIVRELEF